MAKKRLRYMRNGWYDPMMVTYDPDPSPFPIWLLIGVIGIMFWTNPNMLNNVMYMLNPALREEEEAKRKEMLEAIRYVCLVTVIVCGIAFIIWWSGRKKRRVAYA